MSFPKLRMDENWYRRAAEARLVRWLCQACAVPVRRVYEVEERTGGTRELTLEAFCSCADFPFQLRLSRVSNLHANPKAFLPALLLRFDQSPLYAELVAAEQDAGKNSGRPVAVVVKRRGVARGLLVWRSTQPLPRGATLVWKYNDEEAVCVAPLLGFVQTWVQSRSKS